MSEQRMDVFLLAASQPGIERSALVRNLAAAFKKDVPTIEKMLRRPRTLVKSNVGQELAIKYKTVIEKAGGQCELAHHGQALVSTPNESFAATATARQSLALEPIAAPKADEEKQDNSDAACYCVRCGTVIRAGQSKCPKCFTPVTEFSSKSKVIAGVLAFFLGGFGVHRLYLGQWWGLVYLFFYWTLIPSILSLIEAVVFFSTSQQKWDEKYGQVPKSGSALAVVLIVGCFLFIFVMGILAAVALPAYQDYTNRSKIMGAMPLVTETRNKVASFIKRTKTYPTENILVGLPDNISNDVIESIKLQDKAKLEVTYRLKNLNDQNTIVWTPTEKGGEIIWACTEGTMLNKNRPSDCRGDKDSKSASTTATSNVTQKLYSSDKHISIRAPENWSTKNLLPTALIGAANLFDENYVVVVEDSKENFEENTTLDNYSLNIQKQLTANIKNGEVQGGTKQLTIANLPAEQFVFFGTADGIKVAYVVTLIETDKHFYRVLSWTMQSRFEKNKTLLQEVSESLRVNSQ